MENSNKVARTMEFKVLAYHLHLAGMTSKEALLEACKRTKTPVSEGMEQYPGSYMHDYKKTMQKRGNSPDPEFQALLTQYTMKYDRATMSFSLTATVANPSLKSAKIVTGKAAAANDSKVTKPVKPAVVKKDPARTTPAPSSVKEVTPVVAASEQIN